MYDEPLKKLRVDTVRRSESRAVESHTRDLSYIVVPLRTASRTTRVGPVTTIAKLKWTTCSPSGTPTRSNC